MEELEILQLSKEIGTLYAYKTGDSHGKYVCTLYYDEPTRGIGDYNSTVFISNVWVELRRATEGWTDNRIAGRAGIGGSSTNIYSNHTLNAVGHQSDAIIPFVLGDLEIKTLGTSFSLSVELASTGYSNEWNNFQGNSPLKYTAIIECPPIKTTFIEQPYVSETQETTMVINRGVVNVESDFTYSIYPSSENIELQIDDNQNTIKYSNLNPNTNYIVSITATSKEHPDNTDSQATVSINKKTYSYPHITQIETKNLKLNDTQNVIIYNPLKRNIKLRIIENNPIDQENPQQIIIQNITTTELTFKVPLNNDTTKLFRSTESSAEVKYEIVYEDIIETFFTDNPLTISIPEDLAKPQWTLGISADQFILYRDINNATVAITGSPQVLVQKYSQVEYTIDFNTYPGIPKYGADENIIYEVSIDNENFEEFNVSSGEYKKIVNISDNKTILSIRVRARDSRGFYSSIIQRDIPILVYTKPSGSIDVNRKDGYGEIVNLTIYPIWGVNQDTNIGTAQWWYRSSINSEWEGGEILNTFNAPVSLSPLFDNEINYEFKVILTDTLGVSSKEILAKCGSGRPIFWIDETEEAIGINSIPEHKGMSLEGLAKLENATITGELGVGSHSRFENFERDGEPRTACFWIS